MPLLWLAGGTNTLLHLRHSLCFLVRVEGVKIMLRAAIGFFILALIALLFGSYNIAGVSMEAGRLLLGVFIVLAVVSFVVSLISGRRMQLP